MEFQVEFFFCLFSQFLWFVIESLFGAFWQLFHFWKIVKNVIQKMYKKLIFRKQHFKKIPIWNSIIGHSYILHSVPAAASFHFCWQRGAKKQQSFFSHRYDFCWNRGPNRFWVRQRKAAYMPRLRSHRSPGGFCCRLENSWLNSADCRIKTKTMTVF